MWKNLKFEYKAAIVIGAIAVIAFLWWYFWGRWSRFIDTYWVDGSKYGQNINAFLGLVTPEKDAAKFAVGDIIRIKLDNNSFNPTYESDGVKIVAILDPRESALSGNKIIVVDKGYVNGTSNEGGKILKV